MKGKSLLAACIIVSLAALSLAVYLYGNQAKLDTDRYGFFRVQDDYLVTQFGDHLVWLDQYGREQKAQNLRELNLMPHGDFDFFSNGDLLMYSLRSEPNSLELLARLLRLQKRASSAVRPEVASQGQDGLYRCDLQREMCTAFASQLPVLSSSFRLVIDRSTDEVYLADTPAFKLYKLGKAGATLATSDTQTFRFPNQLVLVNHQLWLADTNNHRVVAVSTDSDHFAQVEQQFTVLLDSRYRWPHQIAKSDKGWWVNIGNGDMAHGRIVHFSENGERGSEQELHEMSDPMAIAYWRDTLWLADFAEPILQRYNADGVPLAAVESATLAAVSEESKARYQYYRRVSHFGLGGLILVLVGGFGAAWVLERKQTLGILKTP